MTEDDRFLELVGDITLDEPTDVLNVASLDSVKLVDLYEDTRQELFSLSEMRDARTERGRELHSLRAALLIELKNRGLR